MRTWVLAYLLGHHLFHLFCHISLAHVSLVQRRRKSWPIIVSFMALSTELANENYATTKQAHCDASRKRIWRKKIFTTRRKTSVAPKKTGRRKVPINGLECKLIQYTGGLLKSLTGRSRTKKDFADSRLYRHNFTLSLFVCGSEERKTTARGLVSPLLLLTK